MSGRTRRGRGRPPRTPSLSTRSNLLNLRKPKSYIGAATASGSSEPNSRSSTPVSSTSSTPKSTRTPRIGLRPRKSKGRGLIHSIGAFQSFLGSDLEAELSDDGTDMSDDLDGITNGSDPELELSEASLNDCGSDWSEDSFNTTSSATPRRKFLLPRPQTPDFIDQKDVPRLELPKSSTDLTITGRSLIRALTIYEVLRHFRIVLRLSPFRFEDFCAALSSEERSTLLSETHMTLLKALLREDDGNNTHFSPQDMKDSVNICYLFLDSMTWYELGRCYLESHKSADYAEALKAMTKPDYASTTVLEKLEILHTFTDLFLTTNIVREQIINEGNIRYDDHCRACHRLGDLLCCETCSAVYHLGCVEPPMGEVPDEDWVCTVCKAHQVKGVIDCVSEAEKSGLLCRQDPHGVDRHMRKYWFLSRRIVIEGEDEVLYYSIPEKLDELLAVLDADKWETNLSRNINDAYDEITRQMKITGTISDDLKSTKKMAIDFDKAVALNEEEERREKQKVKKVERPMIEDEKEEMSDTEEVKDDLMELESTTKSVTNVVTTSTSTSTMSKSGEGMETVVKEQVEETNVICSTTTTTTTTTSVTQRETTDAEKMEEDDVETLDSHTDNNEAESEENTVTDANGKPDSSKKESDFASFLKKARAKIFNATEDTEAGKPSLKKMMVVNKDGSKTVVTVVAKTVEGDTSNAAGDGKNMVTRSKTGSLTPKQFTDSVSTSSLKKSLVKSMASEEMLEIGKDIGKKDEITRVTHSQTSTQSVMSITESTNLYRLGDEGTYKTYQNQYTSNQLALNKHQHNEDRLKKQHLSHKFSLTSASDFKWGGSCHGSRLLTIQTLRATVTLLESNLPAPYLHPNWHLHRQNWLKAVQMCSSPQDFAMAIAILEACIKPCLFNNVWHDYLGHTSMVRITAQDREEMKKRDNISRRRKEEDEEIDRTTWAKYTLGLRHQVWKQKGEEFRIYGQGGWKWVSATRIYRLVPQDTVGLRMVALKLKNARSEVSCASEGDIMSETDNQIDIEQADITEPVIDVTSGLLKRNRYPKCVKPASRLDQLLEKRLKQWDIEQKQKLLLTQVIAKYKTLDKKTSPDGKDAQNTDDCSNLKRSLFDCYSVVCGHHEDPLYSCYSVCCKKRKFLLTSIDGKTDKQFVEKEKESLVLSDKASDDISDTVKDIKTEDNVSSNSNSDPVKTEESVGILNDGGSKVKNQHSSVDKKPKTDCFQNSFLSFINEPKTKDDIGSLNKVSDISDTKTEKTGELPASSNEAVKSENESDKLTVKSDPASDSSVKTDTTADSSVKKEEPEMESSALSAATMTVQNLVRGGKIKLTPTFMKEIETKLSSIGRTQEKVSLTKFARSNRTKGRLLLKRGSLPPGHKFLTSHSKRSLFTLEKFELRKLARRSGKRETPGFNYQCKMNNVHWCYPCPRPVFKTSWRYRTQKIKNLAAAALQLRILWSSLKWDEMQQKAPAGGTNTITTDEDITTKELLKRRDAEPYGLRSEYLVREIVVPLGVPAQPKEKYTPQRSGLRERRRPESPKQKEPSVTERWLPEEDLHLWEIKLFGEKLEKQRASQTEKQQNTEKMKAQMEDELKQQRSTNQQKRALEDQKAQKESLLQPKVSVETASGGSTIVKVTSLKQNSQPTHPSGSKIQIQPRPLLQGSSTASVQLPSTTIMLRPKNTISVAQNSPAATIVSGMKPIAPSPALKPAVQVMPRTPVQDPTVATRPITTAVPSTPASPAVQNLRIMQGANGQLHVQGLLPGQQIVRLPDGRLQLITNASQVQPKVQSPPKMVLKQTPNPTLGVQPKVMAIQSAATPTTPKPAVHVVTKPYTKIPSLQSQTPQSSLHKLMTERKPAGVLQTKLVQQSVSGQTVHADIAGTEPATTTTLTSSDSTLISPQLTSKLTSPPKSLLTSEAPHTLLPGKVLSPTGTAQTQKTAAPPRILLSPRNVGLVGQSVVRMVNGQPMLVRQTPATSAVTQPGQQTPTIKTIATPSPSLPTKPAIIATPSSTAAAGGKYAVTPQVVQQVVRQALLQNHDPDLQTKLMALQKQMQKTNEGSEDQPSTVTELRRSQPDATTTESTVKHRALSNGQKEDLARIAVCSQVLKGILDKVEKEDRAEQKRQRKQETAEEKQRRVMASKLQAVLFKQKESLKRDMLKKRALLEKTLHSDIQCEIDSAVQVKSEIPVKKRKESIASPVKEMIAAQQEDIQATKAKKKKTKVISTGAPKSNNKMYCVCKMPYDDTKFYIGCDLCSNWFHGVCVGISEGNARFIDKYVCDECKQQKDTTNDELYCICNTPYDDTKFYIGCDQCQDWFHGTCVGVSKQEADEMETYVCPTCKRKGSVDSVISQKVLDANAWKELQHTLRSLMVHKMSWPFLDAVDREEFPDYYDTVQDPIDFAIIEQKVDCKEYIRFGDFIKDVMRVFDNCRLYNPHDSPYYQCAEVIENYFVQKLKLLKDKI